MGFETGKFVPGVEKDKRCLLCNLVLDNPIKTPCGHLFCSGCILPWVVQHKNCPLCYQTIQTCELENELYLRDFILNSTVRCEFRTQGCTKIVRLLDSELHGKHCEFRPVKCSNLGCDAVLRSRELETHKSTKCPFRDAFICSEGCGLPLLQELQETHDCNDEQQRIKFHLKRDDNTLGVNITGGCKPEKNNNEEKIVTDLNCDSNGIIVSRVVCGSPAAKVGMRVKDLIVSFCFWKKGWKVDKSDINEKSEDVSVVQVSLPTCKGMVDFNCLLNNILALIILEKRMNLITREGQRISIQIKSYP
ncbi:LNX3_4 [Mytilus edulis]|uniref:PDZRN3_4 n=1 Tax=Mytilus edulis TaxID=6550 RepID=A0A8S3TSN6_MYTED|nr:LNX3_4 [Mytilus edulis]